MKLDDVVEKKYSFLYDNFARVHNFPMEIKMDLNRFLGSEDIMVFIINNDRCHRMMDKMFPGIMLLVDDDTENPYRDKKYEYHGIKAYRMFFHNKKEKTFDDCLFMKRSCFTSRFFKSRTVTIDDAKSTYDSFGYKTFDEFWNKCKGRIIGNRYGL